MTNILIDQTVLNASGKRCQRTFSLTDFTITCTFYIADITCQCQGLYDRKFVPLYDDRQAGTTTPLKAWTDYRSGDSQLVLAVADTCVVHCDCCSTYNSWKKTHSAQHKKLLEGLSVPVFYEVRKNEHVVVSVNGTEVLYNGTIRALSGAPRGACFGTATTTGEHPFTCDACYAIGHGKTSSLLRKLNRSHHLKHHRDQGRGEVLWYLYLRTLKYKLFVLVLILKSHISFWDVLILKY